MSSRGESARATRHHIRPEALNLRADSSLRRLFDACDQLEAFILGLYPATGLRVGGLDRKFLSWITTMKAVKTLDCLVDLAERGYGGQAMVLARTVFEDAVVALWCVGRDPSELRDLMESHEKSIALLIQRDLPGRRNYEALSRVPVLSDEALAQLAVQNNVDTRRARSLWTGQSVASMVRDVEGRLSPDDRATLREVFDVAYLLSNLAVHHSATSIGPTLRMNLRDPGGIHFLSRQPSDHLVHDALTVGYHSLSLLAPLVCPTERNADLKYLLEKSRPKFVVVEVGDRPIGRNDLCPCGSGRKWKHCHGG